MIKKYILILILLINPITAHSIPASLVVDASNGEILVHQNDEEINYPASLTKVMTLYITFSAIEQGLLNWDDKLYVSSYASRQPKSNMSLAKGDVLTVEEAVKAMIIRSANDAAVVIAEAIGGSEEAFAKTMNGFAQILGMEDTRFTNASGLTDEGHKSNAKDLIRLSIAIKDHFPQYYDLFSLKSFTFRGKKMYTTNNILLSYKGACGLKTGYTNKAGYNLISSASNDVGEIFAITMDKRSPSQRDASMKALLDLGFKRLESRKNKENKENQKNITISEEQTLDIEQPKLGNIWILEKNISESKKLASATEEERKELFLLRDGGGEWGIQVGAYYQEKQAISAAKDISQNYFTDGFGIEIKAQKTKTKKGRTIYNAIIGGLSKHNAYEMCVDYKKCFIVKPSRYSIIANLD